jgi:hypothetical protein
MGWLDGLLGKRDAIVKDMAGQAESGSGRRVLMAGGIAAQLAEAGTLTLKGLKPGDWVAAELKRQRNDLMRLNSEYTLANPARQIEIRNEILKNGLPGDPVVRRMWSMRDAVSQER